MLFGSEEKPPGALQIGSLDPTCKVKDVVLDAFENAKVIFYSNYALYANANGKYLIINLIVFHFQFLCDRYYLASPDLIVKEHNGK